MSISGASDSPSSLDAAVSRGYPLLLPQTLEAGLTRTLGPYEIRSKLGRGVATVLWRAYDPALEREVALREPVIPHGLDSSAVADFLAGFLHAGRAAAALSHPGLVKVHAAEVYYGRPVLVTELVEGENLAQVLARGALSPASALYVLDELLEAAAYAHAQGVVHEGITAEAVLVTREGRVKVAGFGTARLYAPLAGEAAKGSGAPGYSAPEQLAFGKVDHRSDLFAIGVIGYEMLSGVNPFGASEGLSEAAVSHRIVHDPPAPLLPEVLEGAKADPRAVLGAALAKDPDRRFRSAEEFRAALHGGPVPAGTVPIALAERRPAAGRGPVAVEPRVRAGGRNGRPAPGPRRRRPPAAALGAAALVVVCAAGLGLFFGLNGNSSVETTTSVSASAGAPSSGTSTSVTPASSATTALTLVPGTTTTTTLPPPTTTVAPTTTESTTTTVAPTTTTRRPPTATTRRPTTTQRPTTTTQPPTTTTTQVVTPTTLGPGS